MSDIRHLAEQYFTAFHQGNLDEVFSLLTDDATVKYANEPEKLAKEFFHETKDMIALIQFETLGIFTAQGSSNVIIHFAFDMPNEDNLVSRVEAFDLIEFNVDDKITNISVVPRP